MPGAGTVGTCRPGDHVSLSYAADEECRDLLVHFARQGVGAGHRVVLLLDTDQVEMARALTAAVPDAAVGQFVVSRFEPADVPAGLGVADMLQSLTAVRDQALADGYPGIFLGGQMSWALRAGIGEDLLWCYEAEVNRHFGDGRVAGLCLYDARRFGRKIRAGIGAVHAGPLLRFTVAEGDAHLRLAGEVDASNGGALPSILDLVASADGAVLLDASELTFLDAAAAGTIIRFARSRPDRRTVVRCTRGVRTVLRLVGADSVPTLVLRDHVAGV